MSDTPDFIITGFSDPIENWSKLPHELINLLPLIDSLAELKVILYILRHTWGYGEYERAKHITTDEFEHGRKRKDGSRIDKGIGMSEPSIRDGLKRATEHGFILVAIDDSDSARIVKSYKLNTPEVGERNLPPEGKEFTTGGKETLPRSEKDTLERNSGKILRKSAKKSKVYSKWQRQDVLDYYALHTTELDMLVDAWGYMTRYKDMTIAEAVVFARAYEQLRAENFNPAHYQGLVVKAKSKEGWKHDFSPLCMTKYITDYLEGRLDEPAPKRQTAREKMLQDLQQPISITLPLLRKDHD